MKIILGFIVLVYVVYVTSETCDVATFDHHRDCQLEVCGDNMRKSCTRDTCTCTVFVQHSCLSKGECLGFTDTSCSGFSHHGHLPREWHCEDNKCICAGLP